MLRTRSTQLSWHKRWWKRGFKVSLIMRIPTICKDLGKEGYYGENEVCQGWHYNKDWPTKKVMTLLMTLFGLARSSIITDWLYSGQKNVPFRGTISHTGPDSNNCWLISGPAFITIFWGARYHWTITFASSSSISLPLLYQACLASFFRLNFEWKTLFMCGHFFLSLFHFLNKIQCFNLKSSFNWRFAQNQQRFWIPVRLLYL